MFIDLRRKEVDDVGFRRKVRVANTSCMLNTFEKEQNFKG